MKDAHADDDQHDGELHGDQHARGALGDGAAHHQDAGEHHDEEGGRQVDHGPVAPADRRPAGGRPRCPASTGGSRTSHGHHGGGQGEFEHHRPADDPGGGLAESGVREGVRGARATGSEDADSRNRGRRSRRWRPNRARGEGHRGTGHLLGHLAGEDEDSGAQDHSHAGHDEVEPAQVPAHAPDAVGVLQIPGGSARLSLFARWLSPYCAENRRKEIRLGGISSPKPYRPRCRPHRRSGVRKDLTSAGVLAGFGDALAELAQACPKPAGFRRAVAQGYSGGCERCSIRRARRVHSCVLRATSRLRIAWCSLSSRWPGSMPSPRRAFAADRCRWRAPRRLCRSGRGRSSKGPGSFRVRDTGGRGGGVR